MKRITLNHIRRVGASWRTRAKWQHRSVKIWSGERYAYWRRNGDFTHNPSHASVFSFQDAIERTAHCGAEEKIGFVAL